MRNSQSSQMKIAGVEKKEQNAKNVKNNTQIKTMPMVNNQWLSIITRETTTTSQR